MISTATETITTETITTETIATETITTETIATEMIATETIATETITTETIATEMIATETIATETITTEMITTETIATETITTEMSHNSHLGGGEGRQVKMCTGVLRHRTLRVFLQEKIHRQIDTRQMVDMAKQQYTDRHVDILTADTTTQTHPPSREGSLAPLLLKVSLDLIVEHVLVHQWMHSLHVATQVL